MILPIVLFLNSCKKENVSVQTDKERIIAEIGFDLKTVDFNNISAASKIAPLKFESVEEASKYFKILVEDLKDAKDLRKIIANDKLLSDSSKKATAFSILSAVPPDSTVTLVDVVLWTGYSATFTFHFGGNTSGGGMYSVLSSSYSSGIIGLHPGVSWTPNSGGSYVNYPNSALIYITMTGYQNYNLIINGIGTLYSQPVTLHGVYNTNTHAYTLDAATPQ